MKLTTKFKIVKVIIIFISELIFTVSLLGMGKFGKNFNDIFIDLESIPQFFPLLVAVEVIFALSSTFTENYFYDHWIRLWPFKKIRKELKGLKQKINYSVRKLQIELEKPDTKILTQTHFEGFDTTRAAVLNRCSFEIEQGGVDHLSLKEVISALERDDIIEVIATSDSPINIWFITEMVCYIVVQIRESIKKAIPINRYIIEDSGQGNINLVEKFKKAKYDEYGIVKKIHSEAIGLFVIPENGRNNNDWPEDKSVLRIKYKNDELKIWVFNFSETEFKYCFTEIIDGEQKQKYLNFIDNIQAAAKEIH